MNSMMQWLCLVLLAACSAETPPPLPAADRDLHAESTEEPTPPHTPEDADQVAQPKTMDPGEAPKPIIPAADPMQLALASWLSWAPRCEGYPSKAACDDGDSTLFAGLLCAAGVELGCDGVKASQDTTGRFWRSPRRKQSDSSNSFSRDMALGTLLSIATTKDTAAAKLWLNWIDKNAVCQVQGRNSCLLRTYRFCTDDTDGRCTVTPALWGIMSRVWQKLELTQHAEMKKWLSTAEESLVSATETVNLGFELHLKAVSALIYQKLQLRLPFESELVQVLIERQPENLFFRYLSEGASPELREALVQQCPLTPPALQQQWSWERDTTEQAWLQSMGWDCVFMGSLLLNTPISQ